ncbi:MAG: ion transporter [Bdellovibrionales bacterium RIFOXYD1_FULL_44_7]|nr:MAG: ion transporter [Bdellovibrionales bacterium RIFOXYD1_FULL_44_7]
MAKKERWRDRLHQIIYEADTPEGKLFDIILVWAIILSVLTVIIDSVASIGLVYGSWLRAMEWVFTVLFTLEYALRILAVRRPTSYMKSFFGVIDLLAILPSYISIFFAGAQVLLVLRIFRLLRLFRILKMVRYVEQGHVLLDALKASKPRIIVFLMTVIGIVVISGALLHLVEGPEHGYDNVPLAMYWAVVTMTTVGYGDISPQTPLGQFLASLLMILGYGIIAVPTGIVSVELSKAKSRTVTTQVCRYCSAGGHDSDALFCNKCGKKL